MFETYEDWLARKYPKQIPLFVFRCQQCFGTGEVLEKKLYGGFMSTICRNCEGWGEAPLLANAGLRYDLFFRYVAEIRADLDRLKRAQGSIIQK